MTDTVTTNAGWIEHDGKGMPVSGVTLVEIKCRDGWETKYPTPADEWADHAEDTAGMWLSRGVGTDILSYRVFSKAITAAEEANR